MNFAQIQNSIVVNIVVADYDWVNTHDDELVLIENQNVEIGSLYENGIFIPPQPYPSWTRDGNSWQAPVPLPSDSYNSTTQTGVVYSWDETSLSWLAVAVN